jgi:hypothetical protein
MLLREVRFLGAPSRFKCYIDAIDNAITIEQRKEGGERRKKESVM